MPVPVTTMPTAKVVVEVRFVIVTLPVVVLPVMALWMVAKVSSTPVPAAVAFFDSVIRVGESTDAILVSAGMPVPVTTMPTASVLVEVRLVIWGLPLAVVPVMAPAEKASGTLPAVAVALADSVISVAESIDWIVVPAGMPVPVTSMPAASVLVEVRFVIRALPLPVVPVMAPEEKASTTPVLVAVAFADSLIWVGETTERIVVPAGIPTPVTTMPAAKALVDARLTRALSLVVVPAVFLVIDPPLAWISRSVTFAVTPSMPTSDPFPPAWNAWKLMVSAGLTSFFISANANDTPSSCTPVAVLPGPVDGPPWPTNTLTLLAPTVSSEAPVTVVAEPASFNSGASCLVKANVPWALTNPEIPSASDPLTARVSPAKSIRVTSPAPGPVTTGRPAGPPMVVAGKLALKLMASIFEEGGVAEPRPRLTETCRLPESVTSSTPTSAAVPLASRA